MLTQRGELVIDQLVISQINSFAGNFCWNDSFTWKPKQLKKDWKQEQQNQQLLSCPILTEELVLKNTHLLLLRGYWERTEAQMDVN